jgi:hypothetical protein
MGDDHVEDQAGERAPEHQFDFEIAQGGVLFLRSLSQFCLINLRHLLK